MSRGVNKVILIGNVGADPELRYFPNGDPITTISVATSEVWKDPQTGQPRERTEWTRCVFTGNRAQAIADYIRKGSKIYVEGRLHTRKWEQNGQTKYTTEVRARNFEFLDRRQDSQDYQAPPSAPGAPGPGGNASAQGTPGNRGASPAGAPGGANQQNPPDPANNGPGFYDDDIPF